MFLEHAPELVFGHSLFRGYFRQLDDNRPIHEVASCGDLLYAVENDRPLRLKYNLVIIGVQFAGSKATTR